MDYIKIRVYILEQLEWDLGNYKETNRTILTHMWRESEFNTWLTFRYGSRIIKNLGQITHNSHKFWGIFNLPNKLLNLAKDSL